MSFHTQDYNQFGHSLLTNQNVLMNGNNAPLLFFIPSKDPQRKLYKEKIIEFGGILTENEPTAANNIILISSQPLHGKVSFKPQFIDDCINHETLVDLSNYQNPELLYEQSSQKQPKSHIKFSRAEDEFILEQVRRNPRKRNSHAFFDKLANLEPLRDHSGNSIRSRYRAHLRPRLEFIYKTDSKDNLLTDSKGNLVRVSVEDFPFTLKNRFTADDDYSLCKGILKYNIDLNLENFNPYANLTVPVSFFGNFIRNKEAKGHTVHSWRDRYRKFVSKYGVQNYIDYYEACMNENRIPEPITNKPENDISSEFRQMIGSSYSSDHSNKEKSDALDEEIGEIKSSNIDHALLGQVHDKEDEILQSKSIEEEFNQESKEKEDEDGHSQGQGKGEKRVEEDLNDDEEDDEEDYDDANDTQVDTQSSQISIQYLDRSIKFEDLLNSNFFNYSDPNKLLASAFEALNNRNDSDVSTLFKKFKNLGFNEGFTAHMVMSTNGDVLKIKNFIEYFLNRLYGTMNVESFNEDELYKFFRIDNINGIWNETSDELLDSPDEHKLLKTHSENQIKSRKNFLKALNQ
ncbi:uncharacterized protein PRCAT00004889001 [Priceomyces carsonii]|uniref:uncharacterized protein n=1 Tax=Priceomyces carsonii TaxID=28549 RepID=UPI002EDAE11C|nr:unnamed protein product [Priceomyces carsonii]